MVGVLGEVQSSDAELVGRAQAGDGAAFAKLFRRHHPAVLHVCRRRLGPWNAEAEEIAQAAMVRAFDRIELCQGDRHFGAWVQVIARNLCADAARSTPSERRRARMVAAGLPAPGPDWPEEHLLRRERAEVVRTVVDSLPPRQRAVLVARAVGKRPTEIAAALGCSLGAVDSLLLRARRAAADGYRTMAAEQGLAETATATAVAAGAATVA
ncbi:MAG: RNA polymerase sigma factor, partial [Acidimicrobiia bacterium]